MTDRTMELLVVVSSFVRIKPSPKQRLARLKFLSASVYMFPFPVDGRIFLRPPKRRAGRSDSMESAVGKVLPIPIG